MWADSFTFFVELWCTFGRPTIVEIVELSVGNASNCDVSFPTDQPQEVQDSLLMQFWRKILDTACCDLRRVAIDGQSIPTARSHTRKANNTLILCRSECKPHKQNLTNETKRYLILHSFSQMPNMPTAPPTSNQAWKMGDCSGKRRWS